MTTLTAPAQAGNHNGDSGKNGSDDAGCKKGEGGRAPDRMLRPAAAPGLLQRVQAENRQRRRGTAACLLGVAVPLKSPPSGTARVSAGRVPVDTTKLALQGAFEGTCYGDCLDANRIRMYGWAMLGQPEHQPAIQHRRTLLGRAQLTGSGGPALSGPGRSGSARRLGLGLPRDGDYGIDYRYLTAGGWFSDQLLVEQSPVRVGPHRVYGTVSWAAQG